MVDARWSPRARIALLFGVLGVVGAATAWSRASRLRVEVADDWMSMRIDGSAVGPLGRQGIAWSPDLDQDGLPELIVTAINKVDLDWWALWAHWRVRYRSVREHVYWVGSASGGVLHSAAVDPQYRLGLNPGSDGLACAHAFKFPEHDTCLAPYACEGPDAFDWTSESALPIVAEDPITIPIGGRRYRLEPIHGRLRLTPELSAGKPAEFPVEGLETPALVDSPELARAGSAIFLSTRVPSSDRGGERLVVHEVRPDGIPKIRRWEWVHEELPFKNPILAEGAYPGRDGRTRLVVRAIQRGRVEIGIFELPLEDGGAASAPFTSVSASLAGNPILALAPPDSRLTAVAAGFEGAAPCRLVLHVAVENTGPSARVLPYVARDFDLDADDLHIAGPLERSGVRRLELRAARDLNGDDVAEVVGVLRVTVRSEESQLIQFVLCGRTGALLERSSGETGSG